MLIKADGPVLGIGAQRRNFFDNGNMNIWQRGTTGFSASGALSFAADRWRIYAAGVAVPVERLTADAFSHWCLAFTGQAGNTEVAIIQRLEADHVWGLGGNTITVSMAGYTQAAGGMVAQLVVYKPTARDDYTNKTIVVQKAFSLNTTPNKFIDMYCTVDIPIDQAQLGLEFVISFGAAIAGNVVAATRLQCEVGYAPTVFEVLPIEEDLTKCQRFYEKSYELGVSPGAVDTAGEEVFASPITGTYYFSTRFKTKKRGPATTSVWTQTGVAGSVFDLTAGVPVVAATASNGSSGSVLSIAAVAAHQYVYQWTASAEIT